MAVSSGKFCAHPRITIKQLAKLLTVYLRYPVPYAQYIQNFQWDAMKHPLKRTLSEIVISI